ncbi:MAG: hypothetical protein J6X91_04070 [Bacteroidales bacterium]|nr:hypothetical protein [Bacteroidales bacterium]
MSKTWKHILGAFLYTVLAAAAGAYFWFASLQYGKAQPSQICKSVKVTLLDSSLNKFISKEEVIGIIDRFLGPSVGKNIDSIKLQQIEALLNHRSVVKESQAFVTRDGQMNILIRQRKPVVRIEAPNGGFYIDETAYIFPLIPDHPSYVPVITGNIPENFLEDESFTDSTALISKMLQMGLFLERNPFWNNQIEEVFINDEGDAELITRAGEQRIIFGDFDNIPEKFNKLSSFYQYIVPKEGWDKYACVNLKYRGQIVCTKADARYLQKKREERAKREAEEKAAIEAEIKAKKEAEEKALKEAEKKAKEEEKAKAEAKKAEEKKETKTTTDTQTTSNTQQI